MSFGPVDVFAPPSCASVTQSGFCFGADLMVIVGTSSFAKLVVNGQQVQCTESPTGTSIIDPHWGQKGHISLVELKLRSCGELK
jgi:hypothetical protein